MTPKEKAIELVENMSLATDELGYINTNVHRHKQCALTAVYEILDLVKHIDVDSEDYWEEVKQEIINL